ncbi:MAG: glycosyltransferase [Candidatus Symbiothrix sp.]|jgi:glycosyltransferase involved in cell wall biosynthesis|nr:glycosyltransferase [Candidatus Symbiothrix sp.]
MKILLANKFYYRRGGDSIATINLEHLLINQGHEVAVFAMQHPETIDTPYLIYFPSEVSVNNKSDILKFMLRPFGTSKVKQKWTQLLDDFQPDVVHLNNIHSQLSPVIAQIAHQRGIKVVWTLHDYKLLCPRYDCLVNGKTPCEKCFTDKKQAIVHRCIKNSLPMSVVAYLEAMKWNRKKLETYTGQFICPSRFMRNKMIQGGFNPDKLNVLSNFADLQKIGINTFEKENYYCFLGRISYEKGIESLLKAAIPLPYRLIIIGDGPLRSKMENLVQKTPHISFVGYQKWPEIKEIVSKARFCVLPSECYENNPLSLIESLCLGTPVLGAKIGGIPELIEEGKNGVLFESKNVDDLKNKIEKMFLQDFDFQNMAKDAQQKYSAEKYYKQIINIYKQ